MAAAATARRAEAATQAPRRKPRPAKRQPAKPRPRLVREGRPRQASAARLMKPAMAGAALFPQAAVRSVGAVRDISDSSLIMRLTRGRGWIAVLSTLLLGIVALNVVSLSLNAGSGRLSLQIDELKTEVSSLQAEIDQRLSASRVELGANRLGLAVPDPKSITYLNASNGSVPRLVQLLESNSFLTAPSLPSSYPPPGTSYAPIRTTATTTTTTATTTTPPATPTPTTPTGTPPSPPSSSPNGSSGGGASQGPAGGSTGGVGL